MVQPRAPPDAVASSDVRPRERYADHGNDETDNSHCQTRIRLSRPQKRRRRMQKLAIHRARHVHPDACAGRDNDTKNTPFEQQVLESLTRIDSRLSILELPFTMSLFDAGQYGYGSGTHEEECMEHNTSNSAAVLLDSLGVCYTSLRAGAPEFTPGYASVHTRDGFDGYPCLWRPSQCDIFEEGAPLHKELCDESVRMIQSWWRRSPAELNRHSDNSRSDTGPDDDSESDFLRSSCGDDELDNNRQGNGVEQLAVRRAFLASITSSSCEQNAVEGAAEWSMEQVSSWVDTEFESILSVSDRRDGARMFWCEWAVIEHHFPKHLRKGTIQLMEKKLCRLGFPTLRELVQLQDGCADANGT